MVSRTTGNSTPTSARGTSRTTSSWTERSIRAGLCIAVSRSWSRIMAIFMMSAAVPWMGMLMAIRSPAPRSDGVARLQLGDPAAPAEQRLDIAALLGRLADVQHVVADAAVGREVAS